MADERKCYAGDLTTDALGKVVRVQFRNGVTEDLLVDEIEHVARRGDVKRSKIHGVVQVNSAHPDHVGSGDAWLLPDDYIVEVLP